MNDFRVVIPDESFSIIEFRQQELPGVALINTALRVFDPEVVNAFLQSILNADADVRPRPMDYRMDHDPEWKLAEWHLRELD